MKHEPVTQGKARRTGDHASEEPWASLASATTAELCTAYPQASFLGAEVRPLAAGVRMFGPAITAICRAGQNAAIHHAVHRARAGQVLVADVAGSTTFGVFGELLGICCQAKGLAGAVILGAIRDREALCESGFPVFCLGSSPRQSFKEEQGELNVELRYRDARIRSGDIIVGDNDGVIVLGKEACFDLTEKLRAIEEREAKAKELLRQGKTTYEIFDLES